MDRRDFIKRLWRPVRPLWCRWQRTFRVGALAQEKTDLVAARGADPARTTRAAVDGLGGIRRFVGRGDVEVVKPNIGWDRRPEYAANTNPYGGGGDRAPLFRGRVAKRVKVFV
jgi:hypothetical protein